MAHRFDLVIHPVRRAVSRWAEESQRGACRNAMIASTVLAERRRERLEVAEYLDAVLERDRTLDPAPRRVGSAPPSLPAARLG